ncbi:hypothetical protein [Muricoccus radiodurans]|uniref:hypothetical protein n=1 Tax=Muricoccus radiodurans TaxID=2231721 RepID=UPI003CEF2BDC
MRRLFLAAAASLAMSAGAWAQSPPHGHGDRGPHGGTMQDMVGIHAELILSERTITVHLYEEGNTAVPAAGYTGSALIGSGQSRQVVQLTPGSDNTLVGTAQAALPRGTQVTLQLRNPTGRSGQARF